MFFNLIFEKVFEAIFHFSPDKFKYADPPASLNSYVPLSNPYTVVSTLLGYLVVIFSLQQFMKSRKPMQLTSFIIIHNAFLSFISLVLFVLLVERLLPPLWNHGLFYSICDENMFRDQRLEVFYYLNYLIKYYELLDTVFLVLRKKKLEFLHVYHHSITALLCFTQLLGNTTVQWVPITLNLFVHIVMYYYYARAAMGHQMWWKKYLTTLQIVQFILDLAAIYFCIFTHYYGVWYVDQTLRMCHGDDYAAWFGCGVLSSYLLLFVQFFIETYSARKKPVSEKPKTKTQ